PQWDPDEVIIRKTVSFDPDDPRLDLSGGGSTHVSERRTRERAVTVTNSEVGCIHVRFLTDRPIRTRNVSMQLVCRIGERRDVFRIDADNFRSIVWEVVSDKYRDTTSFAYDLSVTVTGPEFDDEAIRWGTTSSRVVELP